MEAIVRSVRRLIYFGLVILANAQAADSFRIASFNLENYLLVRVDSRPAKAEEGKRQIVESFRAMRAEVVSLQEIGSGQALLELRQRLAAAGIKYPYWDFVAGADTNDHLAVLSQLPFSARRPHLRESFLLHGRPFHVSRGFAELDLRAPSGFSFTLIAAHLKSKRPSAEADESEWRQQEALVLQKLIQSRLRANPELNLVVLGDFNDNPNSLVIRTILGRGRTGLIDTRPTEINGDRQPNPSADLPPRRIAWTHYFGKEDTYSRLDYILLSRGMARHWERPGTFILALPDWGVASDHRPIVAQFR